MRTTAAVTSGPMPSPGSNVIACFIVFLTYIASAAREPYSASLRLNYHPSLCFTSRPQRGSPIASHQLNCHPEQHEGPAFVCDLNLPVTNYKFFFLPFGFSLGVCSKLSNSSRNSFTSLKSRYTDANLIYATLSSALSPCMIMAPTWLVVRSRSGESIT